MAPASRTLFVVLTASKIVLVGCTDRKRPWDQASENAPVLSVMRSPSVPEKPGPGPSAETTPEAEFALSGIDDRGQMRAVPVGGAFTECYRQFVLSSEPSHDVTRIGLMCGPINGMKRVFQTPLWGNSQSTPLPLVRAFRARRGECFRVFAASLPSSHLAVTVRSSRGVAVASGETEDGFLVIQPDRPFCALGDDTLSFEVTTKARNTPFAAEVWTLSGSN